MKLTQLSAAAALLCGLAAPASAITVVDVELALLVDVSGSVSAAEFDLQKTGYVNAFNNAGIQTAIANGNSVAATLIYWSSTSLQSVAVDWTLIDSAAAATSFASAVAATTRPFSGGTVPHAAINFAVPRFGSNDFDATRQVIDVSGDGTGSASATQAARDAALLAGIDQINGLAIGSQGIADWYQANLIGGSGAFVQRVETFEDFSAAVTLKIGREIGPPMPMIPEPSTYGLMALGLGLVGWTVRRRHKSA